MFREQAAALASLVLLASKVRAVQQASRELVESKELAVLRELQALAVSKEQAAVPARPVPLVLWAQLVAPGL